MSYQYNLGIQFYDLASLNSKRTALKYPEGPTIDYEALNQLSNQFANFLLTQGLSKGDVIAIFNEKSPLAYSLMIGCLKAGVIYTNLDVSSPWPRLEKILQTCHPKIIFFDQTENEISERCKQTFKDILLYDLGEPKLEAKLKQLSAGNLSISYQIHGTDGAYIMFTSGSTGFPKGAVMSHSNVINFIQWAKQTFSVSCDDIFTNANPIYFDNSVFDFYASLYSGATLVPLSHHLVKNAQELVREINRSKCSIWFSVPSLLVYLLTTKALTKEDFKSVTRISFGGEGFPKQKLKQLYDLYSERMELYNVYGPTECTCICSSYIIQRSDFENMNELAPLGYLAPNYGGEIIPVDQKNPNIGELCLIGPCVGLGYFNDPERTAKSFVQNPNARFSQIMYKTGDLVERSSNGYFYFRGRIDNQIKHMGYRVELEEVEAAFNTLCYIDEVGVIYERISPELGQIKAFVSLSGEDKDKVSIINDIKKLLPPYMLPRVIKILKVLPKNANGKIDRKQLATL